MNERKRSKSKAKSGGVTSSQIGNYQKVASKSDKVLGVLFKHLESRNESVSLGAAKILINKILPDKKAVELTGENNGPLLIKIIEDIRNNNNE